MNMNDCLSILHNLLAQKKVIYFQPEELLVKGAMHDAGGMQNDLPPESVLHRLSEVALLADAVRAQCGFPLQVISAYRSPAYNAAVGGAKKSCHLDGKALDLRPLMGARMPKLLDVGEAMWEARVLPGGYGEYNSFIHIDTARHRRW